MAWRILALDSDRFTLRAAAISLRVRGTFARALAAASASLRVGVGRPFFRAAASAVDSAGTGAVSGLVRRNKGMLPGVSGGLPGQPTVARTTLTSTHSLAP